MRLRTKLKLLYNYIDFAELLIKPLQESKIKLDLSIIPKSKNTQEFVLWLAGFIERITTGGKSYRQFSIKLHYLHMLMKKHILLKRLP